MFDLILDSVEDFHTVEERRLHRIFGGLRRAGGGDRFRTQRNTSHDRCSSSQNLISWSLIHVRVPLLMLSRDQKASVVDALKPEYSFYTLCRLIGLHHSTYINRQKSKGKTKVIDADDAIFREQIISVFE